MSTSSTRNRQTFHAGLAIVAAFAVAVSVSSRASAEPTEHNARVAEYLVQLRYTEHHNARVAEYLLLQHKGRGIS